MTTTHSVGLRVEFRTGDRLAGRVRDEDGTEWPFSSWLDLLTLIERHRLNASLPADDQGDQWT